MTGWWEIDVADLIGRRMQKPENLPWVTNTSYITLGNAHNTIYITFNLLNLTSSSTSNR